MSSENTVQRRIWLAVGAIGTTLFRFNSGRAWISNLGPKGVQRLQDGSVLIKAARSIALGMAYPNGESVTGQLDLGGWTTIEVTPEMVGRKIAVATFMDAKRSKGGKTSDEQANMVAQVDLAGGIAGIANSPEAAVAIVEDWKARNV
ncbi:hypothetical protein K32_48390 [Kaistia sp. 32K]|uniref:hypothetical protein n=1 Tax=Kaistia sp. 32K TaxID=2795690 RepID=UPI0019164D22|nr:hypothetical protein [Kaistia sp. 32K]BCP56222.1 hypothetical protein K32_48390 [Kaistia sp. 32K]